MAAGFRASAVAGDLQPAQVSSLAVVVPTLGAGGTVVAGDYATVVVTSSSTTATLSTPTGWALNAGPIRTSNTSTWRLSKVLVSGDVGATVTLAFSVAQRCQAVLLLGFGVDATSANGYYQTESTATSSPTLPTVAGVAAGSLVLAVLGRRRGGSPAATLHMPSSLTEAGPVASSYGNSPELSSLGGWSVTTASGSVSGTGSSSSATTGVNYVIVVAATVAGGSAASVTLTTATATAKANPPTVSGNGGNLNPSAVWPPDPFREAWRSGGFTQTFTVSASLGGVPVQGAQAMQPVGGSVTDTNKPGVRRTLSLDLAREVVGGVFIEDLLQPKGTTLTVTAHVSAGSVPIVDIPMGVFDVDEESVTEGGGKVSLTAPDKWVRIQRARFLLPQSSTPGLLVTDQIKQLIQGALGASEPVVVTATSTARVPALTWDRDRDKAIIDLATSIGAWVFFDRNGVATIADVPSIRAASAWLINAGDSGVAISLDRQSSRQGVYNVVVVSSSAASAEAFTPQYVWDGDPTSATYAGTDPLNSPGSAGPFGIVPLFYASPVLSSVSEALTAGLSLLYRTLGIAKQVSLSSVPNAAIDAFDAIDVLPPDVQFGPSRVLERHLVDTVTHPLVLSDGSPQQIAARSTGSDLTADVSS